MKVILIKIYRAEVEMVHVSAVLGTPLGPRDVTVISQITVRGRAGAHQTSRFCGVRVQTSLSARSTHTKQPGHRLCGFLDAIYTSLSLWRVKTPLRINL